MALLGKNDAAVLTAIAVTSLSLGFWVGSKRARVQATEPGKPPAPTAATQGGVNGLQGSEGSDEEDSDSEGEDEHVSNLKVDPEDDCKMVLVVRTDLGMSSGKIAAQCSHAALACYKVMRVRNPTLLRQWERAGQTKIALQCPNEDELLTMQAQALSLDLCARSIQDAGRTQIAAGSRTVLGITGPTRLVNQVTGRLRLL